jgi:hypothetical protein
MCVMIYILNVCLKLLQSHGKIQSHDDWSVANALTNPTDFRRYIRVSWNCMWLKVRLSSLSLFRLHGSGKLVKSDGGKNNNLSKISRKIGSYSLNSCKF